MSWVKIGALAKRWAKQCIEDRVPLETESRLGGIYEAVSLYFLRGVQGRVCFSLDTSPNTYIMCVNARGWLV
jgi:hypothetical protein